MAAHITAGESAVTTYGTTSAIPPPNDTTDDAADMDVDPADMTGEGRTMDDNAGVRATIVGIGRASGDATDDRDSGGETAIVGEGPRRVVATYASGAAIDGTPAALAPAGGVTKKRRAKRSRTGQDARKCLRRAESLLAGRSGAPGPPPPDSDDGGDLV